MKVSISASIVAYNNNIEMLQRAITSCLNTDSQIKLFLIDNSPKDDLKILAVENGIQYIHNPSNPGFGVAHNYAIQRAIDSHSKYHFIVNPDVFFDGAIISLMVDYMKSEPSIGMMMPQILNIDGSVQYLPKLLPSPWGIIWRKLRKPKEAYEKFINRYELRQVPKDLKYNTPIISGCFTLLNLEAVKKVGMYDSNFFMYFEDWDLSRRLHKYYETIYFPSVSVYHEYASGANKNSKLFKIFIKSAITYFNKWGWFFDYERNEMNKKTLAQFS